MKQRDTRASGGSGTEEKRFDWWGGLTGVVGLTLFNIAWNEAPSEG
jgi:hypothetical protein